MKDKVRKFIRDELVNDSVSSSYVEAVLRAREVLEVEVKREPCPFCGTAEQTWGGYRSEEGKFWFPRCVGCGAEGPPKHTQRAATLAWNHREPLIPVSLQPVFALGVRAMNQGRSK